jgi:hypothetical protein
VSRYAVSWASLKPQLGTDEFVDPWGSCCLYWTPATSLFSRLQEPNLVPCADIWLLAHMCRHNVQQCLLKRGLLPMLATFEAHFLGPTHSICLDSPARTPLLAVCAQFSAHIHRHNARQCLFLHLLPPAVCAHSH